MAQNTAGSVDAERYSELATSSKESIVLSYEAMFTYHHMIVQARFATAGLFFTSGTIISAAILSDHVSRFQAVILGIAGVVFGLFVLLLDARNRHLLDNCVSRGLRYERAMKLSDKNGFFGLMNGPQDEPGSGKFVSHSTAIFGLYGLFIILFVVLPLLKSQVIFSCLK